MRLIITSFIRTSVLLKSTPLVCLQNTSKRLLNFVAVEIVHQTGSFAWRVQGKDMQPFLGVGDIRMRSQQCSERRLKLVLSIPIKYICYFYTVE